MNTSIIGNDIETNQQVGISLASRRQGLYCIGVNGTGKSTLISNLCEQDMQAGLGLCLLDPHGDLTRDVLSRVPDHRVQDVILLDLMDSSYPFGLNLFECPDSNDLQAVAETGGFVMHVFEKVWGVGTETPLLSQVLRNITFTLIQNPGTTFAEISLLLQDATAREKLVEPVKNSQVKLFWQGYNKLKEREQMERTNSTLNKVDAFLTQPIIANIVGQSKTTINFREIMDTGKILLVQLNPRLEDISNLVGSVIIGQLLNAALSRKDLPEQARRQFHLYADEYQRYATSDFATLLSEARKFSIGTTIAHQYLEQLDEANRGASVNAANLIVFRISGKDAAELSKEFDSTPPEPLAIGTRPILTPKQDAVDHLVKNGHSNPTINSFIHKYLSQGQGYLQQKKTVRVLEARGFSNMFFYVKNLSYYDLEPHEVASAFNQMSRFFYQVMSTQQPDMVIPEEAVVLFSKWCDFPYLFSPYYTGLSSTGYAESVLKNEREKVWRDFKPLLGPAFEQYIPSCFDAMVRRRKNNYKKQDKERDFQNFVAFIRHLRAVLHALAAEPILVDSGQVEPVYDRPRTYADMQNEIATRLTNLPNYQARVKTQSGEATIKTLPPSSGRTGQLFDTLRQTVQANTRQQYCKPRAEVEEEISTRQENLMKPVQAAPVSRRESV